MRRSFVVAVALAALAAPATANDGSFYITQRGIGHARLGDTAPFMEKWIFERPGRRAQLEGGLLVLRYPKLDIYFRGGWNTGAIGVVTWAKRYMTFEGWGDEHDDGIGPCSPVSKLLRVHRGELKAFWFGGKVVAYRLGRRIWFTVEENGRVGAVQVSTRALPPFAALNSETCRG